MWYKVFVWVDQGAPIPRVFPAFSLWLKGYSAQVAFLLWGAFIIEFHCILWKFHNFRSFVKGWTGPNRTTNSPNQFLGGHLLWLYHNTTSDVWLSPLQVQVRKNNRPNWFVCVFFSNPEWNNALETLSPLKNSWSFLGIPRVLSSPYSLLACCFLFQRAPNGSHRVAGIGVDEKAVRYVSLNKPNPTNLAGW